MEYQVSVCETVPHNVLTVPLEVRPDLLSEGIIGGMRHLSEVAARAGLTANGALSITFHHELPAGDMIVVDFGLPVEPAPKLGPSSGARIVVDTATLVARTCHRGPYQELDGAYRALREWMQANGYRPVGPPTESYLIGPDEVSDPRRLITEIRVPVAPAPAITVHLDAAFPEAVEMTRTALQEHGFGIVTELDMQRTVREKLGEHIEEYVVLGVCNPRLAYRALEVDRQAGLLLPCNVVVRTDETGTLVEAADPEILIAATAMRELRPVGQEARRLLATALDGLRSVATTAS
ncbi:DUF302 domain-containing protein [Nocardia inohanensis]|uniref:DUF302 domain-containing protein n=1 Tax=Nocardia inohanensis TaxID=209246 RepID=UPI000AB38B19|nr:DUF302 domain-containing protein [Nocardia inohanensis]